VDTVCTTQRHYFFVNYLEDIGKISGIVEVMAHGQPDALTSWDIYPRTKRGWRESTNTPRPATRDQPLLYGVLNAVQAHARSDQSGGERRSAVALGSAAAHERTQGRHRGGPSMNALLSCQTTLLLVSPAVPPRRGGTRVATALDASDLKLRDFPSVT